MGYIFRYNSTTRGRTPKRTRPSDSAHRIGPSTLSKDVLTVEVGVSGWGFKNGRIGNVFASTGETSRDRAKRMVPLDSAHRIGVSTLSRGVPNVDEGVCGSWFKNRRIGTFLLPLREAVAVRGNGGRRWIQRIESGYLSSPVAC